MLLIGLGFYRGQFAMSSSGADSASKKANGNLAVNRNKIDEDAESGAELERRADRRNHEPNLRTRSSASGRSLDAADGAL